MNITIAISQDDGYRWERDVSISANDLDVLEVLADEMIDVMALLMSKRHDYGSANIAMTGPAGIAVRLVDKSARLWNLESTGSVPHHETKGDTYRDLIGYCLMGLVLAKGEEW